MYQLQVLCTRVGRNRTHYSLVMFNAKATVVNRISAADAHKLMKAGIISGS